MFLGDKQLIFFVNNMWAIYNTIRPIRWMDSHVDGWLKTSEHKIEKSLTKLRN